MNSAATSPAQVLLARTPPTPSTAAATSLSTSSRYRHAGSAQDDASSSHVTSSNRRTAQLNSPLHRRAPSALSAPLIIHPSFSPHARNPGTVKIVVEDVTYYVHRDVLMFGSSFFEALLSGSWAETSSEAGTSLVGGNQPLGMAERRWSNRNRPPYPMDDATQELAPPSATSTDVMQDTPALTPSGEDTLTDAQRTPLPDGTRLLRMAEGRVDTIQPHDFEETATIGTSFIEDMQELGVETHAYSEDQPHPEMVGEKTVYDDYRKKVEARVVLKEEKASAFQDLLFFIYPHLECTIHWNNVAELMTMAGKFDVPLLRRQCVAFLMASAAGKPIMAMKVAEDHAIPELYREASRYLLDSWSVWEQSDLSVLSETTLLKLEKRRTWFLERLLKLGLINTQRDYVCTTSCPDPQMCARMLDEKWRSAWTSAFRYGSPSPSSIFRILRMLEPSLTSPALHLPHTSCQNHAKAWVADLFDRMFSLGVPPPRAFALPGVASRAPYVDPSSTKKYFLYIDYKS